MTDHTPTHTPTHAHIRDARHAHGLDSGITTNDKVGAGGKTT
jgi:hypothetical protein